MECCAGMVVVRTVLEDSVLVVKKLSWNERRRTPSSLDVQPTAHRWPTKVC